MKVAILNDTHCGARNSSDLFMSYQQRFYEEIFFPYLLEHKITKILHLGDYYEHRKFVNFKALNHNRRIFLNKLREYGIHMYIVPGNHDVYFKNTNQLCSIKELQGYYTDCVTILMKPTVITLDGLNVGMVPWINEDNLLESIEFLEKCPAAIVGGHFELAGFEMNKGQIQTHGMGTEYFSRFEHVLSGHYHTKSSAGNINYLGAQMQFNWSDCDDPKAFHVLDTSTSEITPIHNPITLFERIVYDDSVGHPLDFDFGRYANLFVKLIVKHKSDHHLFERFLLRLQNANPHELKIIESFSEFTSDSVDTEGVDVEDTAQLLASYVDSVDTDLHKPRLQSIMSEVYARAQDTELL